MDYRRRRDSRGRGSRRGHRGDRFESSDGNHRKRKGESNFDHSYTVPGNSYDDDDDDEMMTTHSNGGRSRRRYSGSGGYRQRRRSKSPARWDRGKKQPRIGSGGGKGSISSSSGGGGKTMTDVPGDREIFVGNIPGNINPDFLLNFLNGALRHAKLCSGEQYRHGQQRGPCLSAQINAGGKYAFVEMVDAQSANQCMNLNGVLFLNARVKIGRPKKYDGPFEGPAQKTYQEIIGADKMSMDDVALDSENEKVNRELFVGNTNPEMTAKTLKDFLGTVLGQVGLSIMDGNPIQNIEMFGKYAFLECRTPREATNALNLNNIEFMGNKLQITRPAKYQGVFEDHMNWEQVLARYGLTPDQFKLGEVLNPTALLTTTAANVQPVDGETVDVRMVQAELAQVKQVLEITRHQLEESQKKSEARKEQLNSLNRKWAEGKTELTEHRNELDMVRDELERTTQSQSKTVNRVTVDIDSRMEAESLKKKHEETQGMLRGVTESLLKATEKLQHERQARKTLEEKFKQANIAFSLGGGKGGGGAASSTGDIDFDGLRVEMNINDAAATAPQQHQHQQQMDVDEPMADVEVTDGVAAPPPKMDNLQDFLAKTPKANIDFGGSGVTTTPGSAATVTTPASSSSSAQQPARNRSGVRLCRLLLQLDDNRKQLSAEDAAEVQAMAGKYNLGGFIRMMPHGMIVVEGLNFNCDIFMDNLVERGSSQRKWSAVGKVSERTSRSFPMTVTILTGGEEHEDEDDDFAKACEAVGLKEKLLEAEVKLLEAETANAASAS